MTHVIVVDVRHVRNAWFDERMQATTFAVERSLWATSSCQKPPLAESLHVEHSLGAIFIRKLRVRFISQ